jgi:formate dehydrogenase subunit gamma
MEILRRARNPWGEEVIVGLGWDLFWIVAVLGFLFVAFHGLRARRKGEGPGPGMGAGDAGGEAQPEGVPPRVVRHGRSARISHWILAASVLVLLVTGFVPILALGFPWLTIHWVAGLVLTGYLFYHVVDTVRRGTLRSMWTTSAEWRGGLARLRSFAGGRGDPGEPGRKWGVENHVFHHLTALAGLGVIATGLLMMLRVDTWFWTANPYALSLGDRFWGWVFLLHGLAAVGFVGLLIAHIYFAVRPDKLFLTRSMFKGWITGEEYARHYDPVLWPVEGTPAGTGEGEAKDAVEPEEAPASVGSGP